MGELLKLPNIGKAVEAQLMQVGIETPEALRQVGAKAAWLKIQEIDPSACIHRLLALEGAIGGRDSGCEKVRAFGRGEGRSESVLSGTQAIKNGSRQKRFPFAPQHIQCTIFAAPCPFSVSPTFFAHSCVSSHLAKQEILRYYEDTKKE